MKSALTVTAFSNKLHYPQTQQISSKQRFAKELQHKFKKYPGNQAKNWLQVAVYFFKVKSQRCKISSKDCTKNLGFRPNLAPLWLQILYCRRPSGVSLSQYIICCWLLQQVSAQQGKSSRQATLINVTTKLKQTKKIVQDNEHHAGEKKIRLTAGVEIAT